MKRSASVVLSLLFCCFVTANTMIAQYSAVDPLPAAALHGARTPVAAVPMDIKGQWYTLADYPVVIGYNTAAYLNGAVYSFSGLTADNLPHDGAYKLDIASNTWTRVATLPAPRPLAMAEVVNGKIYIVGGYNVTTAFETYRTVLEFDPATSTFTEKAAMPVAVFGAASFVHQGKIWVLGGGTTSFQAQTDVIQIYDPATDTWTQSVSRIPAALRSFDAAVVKGFAYILGGYQVAGGQGRFYGYFHKGEINGDQITWTQLQDFPGGAIMRHSMGTDGNILYVTGGVTATSLQANINSPLTWAYNPLVNGWRNEVLKPVPSSYSSQMLYDGSGRLYVVGGQVGALNALQLGKPVEAYDINAATKPNAVLSSTGTSVWVKRANQYNNAFTLGNTGGLAMNWSAAVAPNAASWLTLTGTTSGKLDPAYQITLTMTIDPRNLNEGLHTGVITITTDDADHPSLTYTLELNVQEKDVTEPMNVLVEEFTGTWCHWCPDAADTLTALKKKLGDRMVRTAWHVGNPSIMADPMELPIWPEMESFLGVTLYPSAAINRLAWAGERALPVAPTTYSARTNFVAANIGAPVGITIKDKVYDRVSKRLTFNASVFFHQGMSGDLRLNALITEEGVNHPQLRITVNGNQLIDPFYHKAVVRGIYPNVLGQPVSATQTFQTQTSVDVPFDITCTHAVDDSATIVLYVHRLLDGKVGPVQQSYSERLLAGPTSAEQLPVPSAFRLHQNFPNPFNPATTIGFDVPQRAQVTLRVHDALGRELGTIVDGILEAGTHTVNFDGSTLPSGHYLLSMHADGVLLTRTMTLLK